MTRVVAIDGPAAAGKGTLARRLAITLGLPHLDTGLLYRATGRRVLLADGDPADPAAALVAAQALTPADLARPDLRGPEADRVSVPFFFNPSLDTVMPRLQLSEELLGAARGLSADPTNSPILQTTNGDNALRYRLRAHPNVAAAHHADLL